MIYLHRSCGFWERSRMRHEFNDNRNRHATPFIRSPVKAGIETDFKKRTTQWPMW